MPPVTNVDARRASRASEEDWVDEKVDVGCLHAGEADEVSRSGGGGDGFVAEDVAMYVVESGGCPAGHSAGRASAVAGGGAVRAGFRPLLFHSDRKTSRIQTVVVEEDCDEAQQANPATFCAPKIDSHGSLPPWIISRAAGDGTVVLPL